MATLGHVRGRGPTRSVGRDGVGTCSDGANPIRLYHIHYQNIGKKRPTENQPVFI